MQQNEKKIRLSNKLQLGIEGPSSQTLLFKSGGVFFLILSAILGFNIYHNTRTAAIQNSVATAQTESSQTAEKPKPQQQQVLGAYDQSSDENASDTINYTVRQGDTLFNIAQNHNVSWVIIATLNNLQAPYSLKPGTVIKIPAQK